MKITNIGTCIVHMGYVTIPQTATIFSEKLGKKEQVSSTKTYPKALISIECCNFRKNVSILLENIVNSVL